MLMTLPLSLGALGAALERARPRAGLRRDDAGERRFAGSWRMAGIAPILVGLCAAVVMAVALVQTRSRAGILCLALAIVMLGAPLVRRGASARSRILVASSLALVLMAGLLVTGVRPIAGRFAAASWSTAHGRLPIWRQAARMAGDFPIAGSGLNTYQTLVPLYETAELDEPYEAAHNDYLQLAVEGGLLVGVPVLAAVGFFIREARQRFRNPADSRASRWLRTGALVGLSAVAVQETVDFSLQVPGNAALFVILAAIAVHRVPAPPPITAQPVAAPPPTTAQPVLGT
jgi:O-antigen ligase